MDVTALPPRYHISTQKPPWVELRMQHSMRCICLLQNWMTVSLDPTPHDMICRPWCQTHIVECPSMGSIAATSASAQSTTTQSTAVSPQDSGSLTSADTIASSVVGSVAGGSAIGAISFFLFWRRKKMQQQRQQDWEDGSQQNAGQPEWE